MGGTYLRVERPEPWLSGADRAVLSNLLSAAFAVGSLHCGPNRGGLHIETRRELLRWTCKLDRFMFAEFSNRNSTIPYLKSLSS